MRGPRGKAGDPPAGTARLPINKRLIPGLPENRSFFIQRKDRTGRLTETGEKMREILVIEDDMEFSDSLCRMLTRRGYEVASAATARDGLDRFKDHPADLVITDIVLPDRDGIHVILDLQKVFPDVKIIAMSGGGHCASGEEYLRDVQLYCNIQHTLAKPFQGNELFTMIHEMLG